MPENETIKLGTYQKYIQSSIYAQNVLLNLRANS